MIVDSQLHVWTEETPERPWIAGGKQRAHLAEALTWQKALPLMDEAGIDRAIIVPPTWPCEFNDHGLEAATARPDRFAVMGRFAFENPESKKLLPTWKQQ
jgi:predicted TIM-barrel fold metal-dependent hydrolase